MRELTQIKRYNMIKDEILAFILAILLLNLALTALCRKTLCIGLAPYVMFVILIKRWVGCQKRKLKRSVEPANISGLDCGVIDTHK